MALLPKFRKIALWIFIPMAIGITIWINLVAWGKWYRGIYAGFHYNDAAHWVNQQLINEYGPSKVNTLKLISMKNTHIPQGIGPQVRVFQFRDPKGHPYCAYIWGGMNNRQVVTHDGAICLQR